MTRWVCCESLCEDGKLAVLMVTGNFPLGSEAAWVWPPPQPERARVAPTPAITPLLLILQALNAGATYHQSLGPNPVRAGARPQCTVVWFPVGIRSLLWVGCASLMRAGRREP